MRFQIYRKKKYLGLLEDLHYKSIDFLKYYIMHLLQRHKPSLFDNEYVACLGYI